MTDYSINDRVRKIVGLNEHGQPRTRLARGVDDEFTNWLNSSTGETLEEYLQRAPRVYDTMACMCDGINHEMCAHHWFFHVKGISHEERQFRRARL